MLRLAAGPVRMVWRWCWAMLRGVRCRRRWGAVVAAWGSRARRGWLWRWMSTRTRSIRRRTSWGSATARRPRVLLICCIGWRPPTSPRRCRTRRITSRSSRPPPRSRSSSTAPGAQPERHDAHQRLPRLRRRHRRRHQPPRHRTPHSHQSPAPPVADLVVKAHCVAAGGLPAQPTQESALRHWPPNG